MSCRKKCRRCFDSLSRDVRRDASTETCRTAGTSIVDRAGAIQAKPTEAHTGKNAQGPKIVHFLRLVGLT